ncbi:MAG: hypothetical protein SNH63_03200 [Rikenellaceae bacterium]
MAIQKVGKKRIVTSLENLSAELQEAVKAHYPLGFTDAMMRIYKPNGDFFYAVSYATEDVDYLVKIKVKIDDVSHADDDDKSYYDDEIKESEEIADTSSDDDDDM